MINTNQSYPLANYTLSMNNLSLTESYRAFSKTREAEPGDTSGK